MAMTSSSRQSTNVAAFGASYLPSGRLAADPETLMMVARDAYLRGWIDVREFERRVGVALGVR
jgi:hypothetical protein